MAGQNAHPGVPRFRASSDLLTLRVGVSGHRSLGDTEMLRRKIQEVLARWDDWFESSPHRYRVLSSLADGADRLVVDAVWSWHAQHPSKSLDAPELEAILPMRKDLYHDTFLKETRAESIKEFDALLGRACNTIVVPLPPGAPDEDPADIFKKKAFRDQAYAKAGQLVVERCDILIAIWDGHAARGEGGTAEIVSYAKERGRSVVRIDSRSGKITWPKSATDYVSQLRFLKEYNDEWPQKTPLEPEIEKRCRSFAEQLKAAGLSAKFLEPLRDEVIPQLAKATLLAREYQDNYLNWGMRGYVVAVCAVLAAAVPSVLHLAHPLLWFAAEFVLILVVLQINRALNHSAWQRKWIDYRFLAERLRASCFLFVAELEFDPPEEFPDLRFAWLPDGWMTIALRQLWRELPRTHLADAGPHDEASREKHVQALASFLSTAWIEDQQNYYEQASLKNRRRNDRLEDWILGILLATLGVAGAHLVLSFFPKIEAQLPAGFERWLSLPAVALPAVASALAGIGAYMHFHRNAERYESMNYFLKEISTHLHDAACLPGFERKGGPSLKLVRSLARAADRAMSHEHEGWRTVFGVRLPGPG